MIYISHDLLWFSTQPPPGGALGRSEGTLKGKVKLISFLKFPELIYQIIFLGDLGGGQGIAVGRDGLCNYRKMYRHFLKN